MLSEKQIRDEAALNTTYQRGCDYFRMGLVHDLTFEKDSNTFIASVLGNYYYEVIIKFNEGNNLASYQCGCEAYRKYEGACKHVVATLKKILSSWNTFFESDERVVLSGSTRGFLDAFSKPLFIPGESEQEIIDINPTLCFSIETGKKRNWLEFTIGSRRMYVMKSVQKFLEAFLNKTELYYGKEFTFYPEKTQFDTKAQELICLLKKTYADEKDIAGWNSYYYLANSSSFSEEKFFKLNPSNLSAFFDIMNDKPFALSVSGEPPKASRIVEGRPPLDITINGLKAGLNINYGIEGDLFYAIDYDCRYIYHKGLIYYVDESFAQGVAPLLKCLQENEKTGIDIPDAEAHRFFSEVIPAIEDVATIKFDEALNQRYFKETLNAKVYFERFKGGISARVLFQYDTTIINPAEMRSQIEPQSEDRILLRDTKGEDEVVHILNRFSFKQLDSRFYLIDEDDLYTFLMEGLPLMQTKAEVFYSDDFKNMNIKSSSKISLGVRLNTDSDMLEMTLDLEDIDIKELMKMMSSFKLKKKYHRLKNGGFLTLDNPSFKTIAELIQQLDLSPNEIEGKIIALPKYRALYMDSLARETSELVMKRNSAFKKLVQDVLEPHDLEFSIPENLTGTLRDYQITGFKWLKSLSAYGFGGILADDMGLGKTFQILAFVLSEQNKENPLPSLVIAPTSLIYNWQDEVMKFAPTIKVAVICGARKERLEKLSHLKDVDLVVTSYGMMRKDVEDYKKINFKYCFVDEAQHIKNPNTLNAKSVKSIKAQGYFAITGTPIENTLTELWSIFDFVMPGYLKTRKKFEENFEIPIVKNQDTKALHELSRHIRPFVLRRMKRDVLTELPEKIESKMVNEMNDAQRKVYAAYLIQAKKEFETEIQANGFGKSQIKILALLTRLRQICCHPGLFLENYKGSSGKLDMLCELLEDAVSGGHRVLVFSQFTSMLAIIRSQVEALNLRVSYLDGATPAEERMRLVKAFNAGDSDIFLISLKAGGTGLNLTGADMVIHYDPWWNPAVEDQATDRAYRIGQQKAVQVFKLITKDTIEEKIYELQQKKKELIDSVIQSGESFISKMDEKDIRGLFDMV